MEKEIRSYSIEFKAVPESRVIEGRAIPFNVASPNREGFRETVLPEAVEGVIEKSDIFMLYNHDRSQGFLARSKRGRGSLAIETRVDGVYFSFECPTDNLGEYIYQRIEKGDLNEMSWAFTIESDTWTKGVDGVYDRTINKFDELYDFSIVDQSYYGIENAVKCARFAEVQEEERLANEKKMEELRAEEEKKAQEEAKAKLEEYHKKLTEEYQQYINK